MELSPHPFVNMDPEMEINIRDYIAVDVDCRLSKLNYNNCTVMIIIMYEVYFTFPSKIHNTILVSSHFQIEVNNGSGVSIFDVSHTYVPFVLGCRSSSDSFPGPVFISRFENQLQGKITGKGRSVTPCVFVFYKCSCSMLFLNIFSQTTKTSFHSFLYVFVLLKQKHHEKRKRRK
ncbi:unnamed protein product [Orchesella dallaii]|uniref:Uncharacterized protein n=1 Tax=Orchesella dallaii TaxID=48710 RepID=A0ABP1QG80_9HEXA